MAKRNNSFNVKLDFKRNDDEPVFDVTYVVPKIEFSLTLQVHYLQG